MFILTAKTIVRLGCGGIGHCTGSRLRQGTLTFLIQAGNLPIVAPVHGIFLLKLLILWVEGLAFSAVGVRDC